MNKKNIIEELFRKRSEYKDSDQAEMASNLLDTVSSDIYSESQRFVFELIQNADDAAQIADNEVHFDFYKNCLIISHNGQPFSHEDIKSLTSAGSSTKKADTTKTGYKGIGFKSVFGKSERVTIFSDGFQFRFDKSNFESILPWQIIPIWTELNDLPEEIQGIVSKNIYSVSTIIEINNVELLQKDLNELLNNGQILLFLRKVSKISVSKDGITNYSIEKRTISKDLIFNEVSLLKNDKEISSWITKTFNNITVPNKTKEELKEDDTPKKLQDAEFTEISFAAKIEKGKIIELKERDSLIFTYLPTKVSDFKFPFLVNGSFLTNAAREGIHEDKVWNQWLFEIIAEKTLVWLESLATSKYKFQLLYLLPNKFNNTQNELKKSFDNSFDKHSSEKAFLISENENIRKPSEVILDKTGLSVQKFIDPNSITEFLKEEKQLTLSDDCFLNIKVEASNKLKAIKVESFELENIETFFVSNSFTSRHKVSDNFDLIKYFKEKSDNDKQGLWFQSLKSLPFIYDEKELLYNPSNGICFPTGISSTELGEIPIIHPNVFDKIQKDKPLYDWLKKLGIKEPSQIAFVTNVIIPSLDKSDFITASNFLQITHYLFRLFNENLLDDEMLESLRELKIKTKKATLTFAKAQDCYLSNTYQPQLKIEEIIKDVSYVSEEYIFSHSNELKWNLFFKAIKVKDRVEVQTINQNNSLNTLRELTHKDWVDQSKAKASSSGGFGFGEHNVISSLKLPSFLNLISSNREYSKIFWENIISNTSNLSELTTNASYKYGVGYGNNNYGCSIKNYFPWFIKNKNCIPTSTKEILNPENVFINNLEIKQIAGSYLPVFDYNEPLPDDWKDLLQLKDKLSLDDYLSVLSKIVKHSQELEEKDLSFKPPLRRIGLIFNKLASMIPDLTEANKLVISDWAAQNKLLCLNGNFEPAVQLKWITIEGFSTESDKLKIIHLPENSDKDLETFKELISLLKIQTIEEFIPTFDEPTSDFSLKNKLEEILPYYVALIQKKRLEESNQEFERLYNLLNATEFYTASEIKLSFNHQSETFEGPSLRVFKGDNKFYFKGKWKSERTLLSLIKELSNLFNIAGFNEELRFLLLEAEASEIKEWLIEQGVDLATIRKVKPFSKQILTVPEKEIKESPAYKNEETTDDNKFEEEASSYENFEPNSSPNSFDVSQISAKTKVFSGAVVKAETNYSNIESQEIREDVGRWCEEFVYEYLLKQKNKFAQVFWVNQETESGKPYDIKIVEDGVEKFIDVKGTPSGVKDLIYLSPNEWVFMFEKGQNYSIYRVYNAGNDARIEIIENPSGLLQQGKIFPNPITLQI
ncbi:MAG: hypothetical protein ACJA1C_002343 [Crocinitomicaceae bacterium]|jgi:hypothetical protein